MTTAANPENKQPSGTIRGRVRVELQWARDPRIGEELLCNVARDRERSATELPQAQPSSPMLTERSPSPIFPLCLCFALLLTRAFRCWPTDASQLTMW